MGLVVAYDACVLYPEPVRIQIQLTVFIDKFSL